MSEPEQNWHRPVRNDARRATVHASDMKPLIVGAIIVALLIVGAGTYFVVSEQRAARQAAERQADEARRQRLAAEREAREAHQARLDEQAEQEAAEARADARATMVREVRRDIEKSIRAEYRESNKTPSDVGCSLTGKTVYRCIVEYTDEFGETSDLVEARVAADGSFVWSEIRP